VEVISSEYKESKVSDGKEESGTLDILDKGFGLPDEIGGEGNEDDGHIIDMVIDELDQMATDFPFTNISNKNREDDSEVDDENAMPSLMISYTIN